MPELPEVETIRKDLEGKVKGRKIRALDINTPTYLSNIGANELILRIKGRTLTGFSRRGKFLIFHLDSGDRMVLHLGMTGLLKFHSRQVPPEKHTHLIFHFEDSSELHYQDARKLGNFFWWEKGKSLSVIEGLGIEPLSEEFTPQRFLGLLRKKKAKIKPLLMDQSFLAGVGNIYANESLFRSRIHPERKASSLSEEEVKRLWKEIREVLQEAIEYRGSSVDAYRDLEGKKGGFELRLQVYGREGEICLQCGNPIKVMRLGGRGTFFCPHCQK